MTNFSNKPLTLALFGAAGAVAAYVPGEMVMGMFAKADSILEVLVSSAVWIGVLGVGCTVALVMGQNRYMRRPWLDGREAGIAIGGGLLSGILSGAAAQFFYTMALRVGRGNAVLGEASRVVAWAMFGALIGFGMSFIIPNLGKLRGLAGGGISGAVGGIGFILGIMVGGNLMGRLLGLTVVGFVLGYVIGLVEEATRTAWLQVMYGQSREMVRVSLGPELVCVGGNSQRCAIWAQGARPIALRFRYVDGQVICDDMAAERTVVVEPGTELQVGNVHLTVCCGATPHTAAANAPSTAPPAPAAAPWAAVPPPPAVARPGPPPLAGGRPATPQPSGAARPAAGRPGPPPPPPPPRR